MSEADTQLEALRIPVPSAITEYMTTIELINAESRAFKCEFPPREMIRELDTGIAWRITKFAQAQGGNYTQMLVEYGVSGGYTTLTGTVAIKWLKHNNLIAKFNAWDAADVRHNFAALRGVAQENTARTTNVDRAHHARQVPACPTGSKQRPTWKDTDGQTRYSCQSVQNPNRCLEWEGDHWSTSVAVPCGSSVDSATDAMMPRN